MPSDVALTRTQAERAPRSQQWFLIALFTISGFSGLIYESIWAQYLKLLLGHAAYAQTLVLMIFMGGMAIGSWWLGKHTVRIRNLLLGYAVVEGIIGLAGLAFHPVFDGASNFAAAEIFPALASPAQIAWLKWGFAALLITPQSILLGMTFPLMSGAFMRRFPENQGRGIAALYFSNSLGATVGVLASGFILLPAAGLPGTVLAAGIINIVLAGIVYLLSKTTDWQAATEPAPAPVAADSEASAEAEHAPVTLLLMVAALTGLASFVYEIGWIRMLSMVLGASTHAFELMLAAFILGLALGSLWIQGRIQNLGQPVRFLGWVQIVMGLLAIGTLIVYGHTFDWMAILMQGLERNDAGYALFNLASQGVAMVVMLPVTICAGMTLPLITFCLLRGRYGERSIGQVYAANTAGAIVGVLLAVHVGLPLVGLKVTIVAAASIDILVGLVLIRGYLTPIAWRAGVATLATAVLAAVFLVELDPKQMASGVFRYGRIDQLNEASVVYAGDGKTATVHVVRYPVGIYGILTNGKTDSSMQLNTGPEFERSLDEYNMALLSALPMAANTNARRTAVIGFGAGLSTHVMLGNPALEIVDTIEIEPRMVEASRVFHPRVFRGFDDPRSVFRYDDARTFFAASKTPYDIIVSEPSTPWVSGIASLYTEEFYAQIKRTLSANGLFAQWLHGSELSMNLTALVGRTLGKVFDDYVLFNLNGHDAVFIASVNGPVKLDVNWPFSTAPLNGDLANVHLKHPDDLRMRFLGDRALLEPWFRSLGSTLNSDYFPLLDLQAVRARFERKFATDLYSLRRLNLPIVDMLSPAWRISDERNITAAQKFEQASAILGATRVARALYEDAPVSAAEIGGANFERMQLARLVLTQCANPESRSLWYRESVFVATNILPLITPEHAGRLTASMKAQCAGAGEAKRLWLSLLDAVGQRDAQATAASAGKILSTPYPRAMLPGAYVVGAAMLGELANGNPAQALKVWQNLGDDPLNVRGSLEIRLLHGYGLAQLESLPGDKR